jgi:hypothetical protein
MSGGAAAEGLVAVVLVRRPESVAPRGRACHEVARVGPTTTPGAGDGTAPTRARFPEAITAR